MTVADNLRKLCLGTVQFGLDYGIANTSGKIVQSEVFEILRYAAAQGIDCLDTASVYGDSERVIGAFLKESPANFKVISKWVAESGQLDPVKRIENQLRHTLQDLNLESLDGYLVHHFHDFRNHEAAWTAFAKLKQQGLIRSIGFSLYKLEDLE